MSGLFRRPSCTINIRIKTACECIVYPFPRIHPPMSAGEGGSLSFGASSTTPLGKYLSTFAKQPIVYKGKTYPTMEHAFQAQKYLAGNKAAPELAALFESGHDIGIDSADVARYAHARTVRSLVSL